VTRWLLIATAVFIAAGMIAALLFLCAATNGKHRERALHDAEHEIINFPWPPESDGAA